MRESGLGSLVPSEGYAVERERDGRALLSYDVDGRTKVSMYASNDVRDWNRDRGWGIRAAAQCDPSELPADLTDDLGIGVWEDTSGRRVSVDSHSVVRGRRALLLDGHHVPAHRPGEEGADWYVRDTQRRVLRAAPHDLRQRGQAPRGCDRHGLAPRRAAAVDRAGRGGGLPGEPRRCTRMSSAGRRPSSPSGARERLDRWRRRWTKGARPCGSAVSVA